jgi:hypothetical protein
MAGRRIKKHPRNEAELDYPVLTLTFSYYYSYLSTTRTNPNSQATALIASGIQHPATSRTDPYF